MVKIRGFPEDAAFVPDFLDVNAGDKNGGGGGFGLGSPEFSFC